MAAQSARGRIDSDGVGRSSRGCASRGAWQGEISSKCHWWYVQHHSTGITKCLEVLNFGTFVSSIVTASRLGRRTRTGVLVPACADCESADFVQYVGGERLLAS